MGGVAARNRHTEMSSWSSELRTETGRYCAVWFSSQMAPGSAESVEAAQAYVSAWEPTLVSSSGQDQSLISKGTNLQCMSKQSGEVSVTVTMARWWLPKQFAVMSQVRDLCGETSQKL